MELDMAERILRVTMESCWGMFYEHIRQIDVIKYENGTYCSKYTWKDESLTKQTLKKQMSAREVEDILSSLANLNIPASPNHDMGCDGGFTELEIGGYGGMAKYRWWSCPPVGWEKLDKITQGIIDFATEENS